MAAIAALFSIIAVAVTATPVEAKKVSFGTQDYFTKLADVSVKGPKGETLHLSHKYSMHSFIAPYMLEDGGYVLSVTGGNSFYKLSLAQIEDMQSKGLLPKPLPPYEFGPFDYMIGYLVWWILGGALFAALWSWWRTKQRAPAIPLANSGLAHHRAGNLDAAIADYDKALAINPALASAIDLRASAYVGKGETDRAVSDYSKLIKMNAKNAQALCNRAQLFLQQQRFDPAISDLTRAVKLDKKASVPLYIRGLAYGGKGDVVRAIKDFTAVLKIDPTAAEAYDQRAKLHAAAGRTAEAASDAKAAAEIFSARATNVPVQQA